MICDYSYNTQELSQHSHQSQHQHQPCSRILESQESSVSVSSVVSDSETSLEKPSFRNTTTTTSSPHKHKQRYNTRELCVPQDVPTVEAAVAWANAEFQRAAAQQVPDVTITILLDPRQTYQVAEPLVVQASGRRLHGRGRCRLALPG